MTKDSLGDRMKNKYEKIFAHKLPERMPVIIRLDGKAFHTLSKGLEKPFDNGFIDCMDMTALYLCQNIQNAQMAYIQSDEISILLNNYKKLETQSWFDNEIQKMVSISASLASSRFTVLFNEIRPISLCKYAQFDSRVFVLPEAEVCNYFIWRQQDWTRNSIQMLARSYYSHKECHKKNQSDLQEMIHKAGDNWNNLKYHLKRGRCALYTEELGWGIDYCPSIFTKDRKYIERHLEVEED